MARPWSAELQLVGAGGEPVDLRRTLVSHGVADLPPNEIDETACGGSRPDDAQPDVLRGRRQDRVPVRMTLAQPCARSTNYLWGRGDFVDWVLARAARPVCDLCTRSVRPLIVMTAAGASSASAWSTQPGSNPAPSRTRTSNSGKGPADALTAYTPLACAISSRLSSFRSAGTDVAFLWY